MLGYCIICNRPRLAAVKKIKGVATMQDNKNTCVGLGFDGRGTVCIDTKRVLDCCRDRDCFEDSEVFLTAFGEETLAAATSVRTKRAKTLCVNVNLEEVPFNCGFFRVKIRHYIELELEACLGLGRSQTFGGLTVLEKEVVLYGGDGTVTSYSSGPESTFCGVCNADNVSTNAPTAIVDTVEPVVLGTRIVDCSCAHVCIECCELPTVIRDCFDGDLTCGRNSVKLTVSLGIFSVIRLVRPALLLVQATDYSVPDKECTVTGTNENPCDLFRAMAFPVARFSARCEADSTTTDNRPRGGGGCGCGK